MKKLLFNLFAVIISIFALNFSAKVDAFSSTIMLEARTMMDARINAAIEMRKNYSKIMDCALESTKVSGAIISKDLQTSKITYMKNKLFTVNSTRSCSEAGEQGGSGIATVTFVHRNVGFWISKSQAGVNDFDYIKQLANNLYQAEQSLCGGVDTYLVAQLAAYKSTVNLADEDPNILNTDVMEVVKADVPRFYSLLRSDMKINNYDDSIMFYDIANSSWKSTHNAGNFGGVSNLMDKPEDNNVKQFFSNSLGTAKGTYGSFHYVIPEGGLYLVDRMPASFDGEIRGSKQMLTYSSKLYPGIVFQLTIDKNCTDTSLTGGKTADAVNVYTLGWDFAAGLLPLSNSGETMNMAYATLTT